MLILTEKNRSYNLDCVPEQLDDDLRFCVWSCADEDNTDFYWLPLIFLESFSAPAVVLEIGEHTVQMPLDWSMLVCDDEFTSLEVMPLTSLNDRGFHTLMFNPLTDMVPTTAEITIVDVYADVKWFFPKLKHGNVLMMPLKPGVAPPCALFVKEGNRIPDPLDVALLFQ